jgi:hypothetical protein
MSIQEVCGSPALCDMVSSSPAAADSTWPTYGEPDGHNQCTGSSSWGADRPEWMKGGPPLETHSHHIDVGCSVRAIGMSNPEVYDEAGAITKHNCGRCGVIGDEAKQIRLASIMPFTRRED